MRRSKRPRLRSWIEFNLIDNSTYQQEQDVEGPIAVLIDIAKVLT